uniref:Uncharacterized protein n=1 Tax=Rousettus aegyptiacus TaxID=9407 RepID=A0A7J8BS37_ROUAE|nr:hypothetical protein HJG63_009572 [Rousettus aegyptiacus]
MQTCFHSNPQSHISFQLPVDGHSDQLMHSRNSSMMGGQAGQGKAFQDGRDFRRLKGRSQLRGDRKAVEQGPMMGKACSGHRAFARAVPLPVWSPLVLWMASSTTFRSGLKCLLLREGDHGRPVFPLTIPRLFPCSNCPNLSLFLALPYSSRSLFPSGVLASRWQRL